MPDVSIQTVDLSQARRELERLYRQVAREHQRVEFGDAGSDDVCVLISKAELESLERALEILGDSDEVRQLREAVSQLCTAGAG
jgi:PHD/YefM family antitoxin component YafN of YafNO toxin-antitoxin module